MPSDEDVPTAIEIRQPLIWLPEDESRALDDVRNRLAAIDVTAPARLHLGFLDLNGGLGRRFGSIGLAVDQPSTRDHRQPCPGLAVPATSPIGGEAARALKALERFTDVLRLQGRYSGRGIACDPAHAGLGSGTQLALAIGAALRELEGRELKRRVRSPRSRRTRRALGIGIAAFEDGGFIIDGGRGHRRAAAAGDCCAPIFQPIGASC